MTVESPEATNVPGILQKILSLEIIKKPKTSTLTTEKITNSSIRSGIVGAFDWIYGYGFWSWDYIFGPPSLKFHSKMLPKKKSITLATAAVRHGREPNPNLNPFRWTLYNLFCIKDGHRKFLFSKLGFFRLFQKKSRSFQKKVEVFKFYKTKIVA